jgi:putative spermidine/putrescine transport system permease protein
MMAGPASWGNYRAVFFSPLAQRVFIDTLRMSLEITLIAGLLGYPMAYLLARSPSRRVHSTILFVLTVTFFAGGITRAYAWMIILGNNGPINRALRDWGFASAKLINNETGVVISLVHFVIPFFVLTLFATIRNIPASLEEAARNLGGRRWQAFWRVTLPLSLPGLISALLLTFTITLSSFLFPLLLGGGRVQMVASLIYDKMQNSFDMPASAAMSLLFLLLSLIPLSAISLVRSTLGRRFGGSRR